MAPPRSCSFSCIQQERDARRWHRAPLLVAETPSLGRYPITAWLCHLPSCTCRALPQFLSHGRVVFRSPHPRGSGADQYRQDTSCDRAHARPSERHDRLPAAPAGARELRPHRPPEGRAGGGADHRRGKDRPAQPVLFRLHRRIDAARPPGRFPRHRRDPALRRSRARPRLYLAAAARARPPRDHAARRRHHPPVASLPGARGGIHLAAPLLDALL